MRVSPGNNFSVRHHRFERNILQRGGKNSSPNGQNFSAHANGLGKIARHMAQRGQKQISETVSAQSAARMKTILKQTAQQRFVLRERHHAVANIAGRQHAVFAPQAARTSAVIGDRDDRGEIADRMAVRFLAAPRNIMLQSAQQHGKAGAAADGDHTRSHRDVTIACRVLFFIRDRIAMIAECAAQRDVSRRMLRARGRAVL